MSKLLEPFGVLWGPHSTPNGLVSRNKNSGASRNKTLVCNATFEGSDIDKAVLKTNMVLPILGANVAFATDIASRVARTKSECEFWVVAGETEAAKNVASLAQKLLSCSSSMGDVERCYKVTARTRTKVSNRKLASTTEAYCKIAVSESNKRYQGQKKPNAMQAFRRRLSKVMKIREERVNSTVYS